MNTIPYYDRPDYPHPIPRNYSVEVLEGEEWIALPERHSNQKLAFQVARCESDSRNRETAVRLHMPGRPSGLVNTLLPSLVGQPRR